MRIRKFCIQFDRNLPVYRAGDTITGHVVLHLIKPLKLRGIRLHIVGAAFIRWEYGRKKTSPSNNSHIYKDFEKYFDFRRTVWGREETDTKGKNCELSKGEFSFDFTYQLPEGPLPSSLEGTYGYVRYFARAIVDRPLKRNVITLKPFTVCGILDLNNVENASNQLAISTNETSKCLCCTTGARQLSMKLDRKGYCPGEQILITAIVENDTNNKILRTSAELLQILKFRGYKKGIFSSEGKAGFFAPKSHVRRTRRVMQRIFGEGCGSHNCVRWSNAALIVPAIPPSKLDGCSSIEIEYLIRFTCYMKNGKRMQVETPITIGTEPLTSTYGAYYGPYRQSAVMVAASDNAITADGDAEPTAPPLEAAVPTPYTGYDCPPPSYEECVYGGATLSADEFTMGQTTFVPVYQVYSTLRRRTCSSQATASLLLSDSTHIQTTEDVPVASPTSAEDMSMTEVIISHEIRNDDEDEEENEVKLADHNELAFDEREDEQLLNKEFVQMDENEDDVPPPIPARIRTPPQQNSKDFEEDDEEEDEVESDEDVRQDHVVVMPGNNFHSTIDDDDVPPEIPNRIPTAASPPNDNIVLPIITAHSTIDEEEEPTQESTEDQTSNKLTNGSFSSNDDLPDGALVPFSNSDDSLHSDSSVIENKEQKSESSVNPPAASPKRQRYSNDPLAIENEIYMAYDLEHNDSGMVATTVDSGSFETEDDLPSPPPFGCSQPINKVAHFDVSVRGGSLDSGADHSYNASLEDDIPLADGDSDEMLHNEEKDCLVSDEFPPVLNGVAALQLNNGHDSSYI